MYIINERILYQRRIRLFKSRSIDVRTILNVKWQKHLISSIWGPEETNPENIKDICNKNTTWHRGWDWEKYLYNELIEEDNNYTQKFKN